jgi:CRP-like cAMP-binding protein
MSVPVTLIHQFPLFDGIPQAEILSLALASQMGSAKANQEILARNSNVQYLSFVVAGQLQLSEFANDGRIVSLTILGPGDAIGFLALADEKPTTYSVRTLTDTNLLVLPMANARRLALTQPLVTQRIFRLLAQLAQRAQEERAMLSLPSAFHRVFVQLNLLANNDAKERNSKIIPRQQDLANMVNTSRETVSRALQLLIKQGILSKNGHQILIEQSDALNQLAQKGPDVLTNLPPNTQSYFSDIPFAVKEE